MEDNTTVTPLFGKRFADAPPPKPPEVPEWRIVYQLDKDVAQTLHVKGYLSSLMPFFMVSSVPDSKSLSETVFLTAAERIIDVSRGQETSTTQEA